MRHSTRSFNSPFMKLKFFPEFFSLFMLFSPLYDVFMRINGQITDFELHITPGYGELNTVYVQWQQY